MASAADAAAPSSSSTPSQQSGSPPAAGAASSPAAWIAQLLQPDGPLILATLAAIVMSAASSLCLPLAIGRTFDAVGAASGGVASPDYQPAVTSLFVTLAAAAVCNAVNFALAGVISQRAGTRLRTQLFAAVVARDQAYFDQARKGEVVGRLTLDVEVMQASLASLMGGGAGGGQRGVRGVVEVLGGTLLIMTQAPLVGAMLLAATPLLVALARRAVGASGAVAYDGQRAAASALELANERVTQVQTVKLAVQEAQEERAFGARLSEIYRLASRGGVLQGLAAGAGRMVINVQTLVILSLGGLLLLQGKLSVGELLSTNVLIMFVTVGLTSLAASVGDFGKALGAARRMSEMLSQQQLLEAQLAAAAEARRASSAAATSSRGGVSPAWWSRLRSTLKQEVDRVKVGSQLLVSDTTAAAGLAGKRLRGTQLSRLERAQLTRTAVDLAKLLPLAVYLLIPFSELGLPFIFKFAPGLLPSTYSKGVAKRNRSVQTVPGMVVSSSAYPSGSTIGMQDQLSISFRGVSFAYPGRTVPVLSDLDLEIPAGKTVALVGPSGSGKSSIAALLLRLYEPSSGEVLVNGERLVDLPVDQWRRHVAAVMQTPGLMSGTIADNIRYGRPEASMAEVQAAADAAGVSSFACQLPAGLETHVGERGGQLSGGQRQRVAIARALLMEPQVLVLDEATSALDVGSEAAVTEALAAARASRTTLIIAHRLSTVRSADEIAVVQGGRVVERGTHDDLMALPGSLYSELVTAGEVADAEGGGASVSQHSSPASDVSRAEAQREGSIVPLPEPALSSG